MLKVRIPHIGRGREEATPSEPVDDQLGGMRGIKVRVIKCVRIEYVQFLRIVLRASRVQIEVDLWMRTSKGLLKARVAGVEIVILRVFGGGFCEKRDEIF